MGSSSHRKQIISVYSPIKEVLSLDGREEKEKDWQSP